MAKYRIIIKKSAAKELQDIPQKYLLKIIKSIQSLSENPRLIGSQKLSARQQYRVRQGDYRIIYSVDNKEWLIDIVKIGHRREVYH